tara:strand:+ start:1733 stop:1972 length:240 start_codon:yes stop_codon:yes gene_type:complete
VFSDHLFVSSPTNANKTPGRNFSAKQHHNDANRNTVYQNFWRNNAQLWKKTRLYKNQFTIFNYMFLFIFSGILRISNFA